MRTPLRLAAAAVVIAGLATSGSLASGALAGDSPSATTSCEGLPQPWIDATETAYDADGRTVTFTWDDVTHATVADTEPSCPGQEGLPAELRGIRTGYLANERASCRELQALIREIKVDQRTDHGLAPVSRQAAERAGQAAAYDKAASAAQPWTVDLDQADQVLATDCQ